MQTVLIVDDDPEMVRSTADLLEAKGFRVISAANGTEGYACARRERPDLIILDVMMTTEQEGFETARQLKADPATRDLPIILLTGIRKAKHLPFGFEPDETWLPVGVVLEKPIRPDDLVRHVRETLNAKTN